MRNYIFCLLTLGMLVASVGVEVPRAEARDCIAEGFYDATLTGDHFNARLWGRVGMQMIDWRVSLGWVDGMLNGRSIRLRLEDYDPQRPVIEGWIERTYIRWQGQGNHW